MPNISVRVVLQLTNCNCVHAKFDLFNSSYQCSNTMAEFRIQYKYWYEEHLLLTLNCFPHTINMQTIIMLWMNSYFDSWFTNNEVAQKLNIESRNTFVMLKIDSFQILNLPYNSTILSRNITVAWITLIDFSCSWKIHLNEFRFTDRRLGWWCNPRQFNLAAFQLSALSSRWNKFK